MHVRHMHHSVANHRVPVRLLTMYMGLFAVETPNVRVAIKPGVSVVSLMYPIGMVL